MKKLIDKLEKECLIGLKDAGYGGWQTGFRDAIDIVRAHNPWHEVGDLPEMRNKDYSVRVMVINNNGRQHFGYYYLPSRQWFDTYDATEIIEPAKWAYLPEVKP